MNINQSTDQSFDQAAPSVNDESMASSFTINRDEEERIQFQTRMIDQERNGRKIREMHATAINRNNPFFCFHNMKVK